MLRESGAGARFAGGLKYAGHKEVVEAPVSMCLKPWMTEPTRSMRREIADSSLFHDPAPLLEVGFAYRTCLKLKESDSASPLALPMATIRVGDLLG